MKKYFNCECCSKKIDGIISIEHNQGIGCSSSVHVDNKNKDNHYIICHYGSDYDTNKFLIKDKYINEFKDKQNICDECISLYLKREYILKDMFYQYF